MTSATRPLAFLIVMLVAIVLLSHFTLASDRRSEQKMSRNIAPRKSQPWPRSIRTHEASPLPMTLPIGLIRESARGDTVKSWARSKVPRQKGPSREMAQKNDLDLFPCLESWSTGGRRGIEREKLDCAASEGRCIYSTHFTSVEERAFKYC